MAISQTETARSAVEQFLLSYGIDIGFLISGFFGALLLVPKNSAQRVGSTLASLLAGTACANYLTPVVMSMLPDAVQSNGKYAVAFVMGFMGLKGLEMVINRYFTAHEKKPTKRKVKRPTKKKRK